MKPAPFAYFRARSVAEAVDALAGGADTDADTRVLAGGQSLVPLMNLRLARPARLVDVNGIAELDLIEVRDDHVVIGALVRHQRLVWDRLICSHVPLLAEAAGWIGHGAIRARGTVGGSLAHADPAAELPVAALALDAEVEVVGPAGGRRIPMSDFVVGSFATALAEGELVVALRVPRQAGARDWGFAEFARRSGDFGLALAAATVTVDGDGVCRQAAIAVGGAVAVPLRSGAAARALVGRRLDDGAVTAAVDAARAELRPVDDIHGGADYRRALAGEMVARALSMARGGRR